jgi:hypothetical protein
MKVTLKQAKEILAERSNGVLADICTSKGGRAWLDGEWQLAELESLCIVIREKAGKGAEGAEELVRIWENIDLNVEKEG